MCKETANSQHAYLLDSIDKASKALSLFELLRNKKFTTGTTKQDNWLEEILLSFITIKMHTIFDNTRNALCLDKFLKNNVRHITNSKNINDISKQFEIIKKKHCLLIKQIKNNRHENGHIPQKTKLGVTEEVAVEIRKLGKITNNQDYINQKSVLPEQMRFSVGNFPVKEAKELSEAVRKELSGYSGTVNTREIEVIHLEDEGDIPTIRPGVETLYRFGKRLDFTIWYQETAN